MSLLVRGVLNIAALVTVGSLLALAGTRPGTAGRSAALAALLVGGAALVGTVVAVRLRQRRRDNEEQS